MDKYIMALDQGTSSSRCIIFNKNGGIKSMAQKEIKQFYPQNGWVEEDAQEIYQSQVEAAREALIKGGLTYADIKTIGIANQRETTVVWDKRTGEPVYNAIVWQCRRTADFCNEMTENGWTDKIREKCGLVIDSYFSGTKLKWILDNVPGVRENAIRGNLLFGTIDTWLVWNLTGGRYHITDYSNASRTMLFNIRTLNWDNEILDYLGIPISMLPDVKTSSAVYGETDPAVFGGAILISGIAGDQQAALFGQACFEPGMAKNTYGTGCFMLMNTGDAPVFSKNGLLTTIAWGIDGKVEYALEGSVFTAGAAIQWLRDELGFIQSSEESETWALGVGNNGGVYVVPAFTGLGAPYWDPYARGIIIGLTRDTNKSHIVRATLESLAYQTLDVLEAMRTDADMPFKALMVDGGACSNNFLMQFQADIIGFPVKRPNCIETTALGAAYLAGLSVGYWKDRTEIMSLEMNVFEPQIGSSSRNGLVSMWRKAVGRAGKWI